MLLTIDKNKSLSLLQIAVALFIIIAPPFLGAVDVKMSVYIMFFVSAALTALRVKTAERIHYTVYHLILSVLLVYTVISALWVNNKEGQLVFIFALGGIICLYTALMDYFSEGTTENMQRRIMYMICIGAVLCAVTNIMYWLVNIIPFASHEKLSFGLGTNNFLAIFMMLSFTAVINLMKGNSKARKRLLFLACIPIIFVFVFAKSIIAYVFGFFILLSFLISKKFKKAFSVCAIISTVVFTAIIIFTANNNPVLNDVFRLACHNLLGTGGGFWSGKASFATTVYSASADVGLLPFLFASSGIIGIITALAVVARNVMSFLRLKTWESLISLHVTILIMLLPYNMNFTVTLLWIGLIAYNECALGMAVKLNLKKETVRKTAYVLSVMIVFSAMLFIQLCMRNGAQIRFNKKDYIGAAQLYKTASIINPADSESCRMYAMSLRLNGNNFNSESALLSIDKAIKRDPDNIENIVEKALIYYEAGDLAACAEQYRTASGYANVNDEYNLALVKVLSEIVQGAPAGSSETKRAYEEILEISNLTENLDVRKEINDIADEVQSFTKGELVIEQ